jgi:predicted nuclease with TOPRIM domain
MPTNKELENQIQQLEERLSRVQASNSRMRDDVSELKLHYDTLVEGLNTRFEDLRENFRNELL